MNLSELKAYLIDGKYPDKTLIFKYAGDIFLVNQYLETIQNNLKMDLIYLDSLEELKNDNYLLKDNSIYVYKTSKLKEFALNKSLIVVCESIDKEILGLTQPYVIEFPALENWQIKDYVLAKAPKLKEENVDLLCKLAKYNPYRIDNELKKLSLFGEGALNNLFNELIREDNFRDLSPFSIFDLSNFILKKDKEKLKEFYTSPAEVEPLALVSLLEKNLIIILNLQTNPRVAPEELGLNYRQLTAIKYNCGVYNSNQILNILDMLSSIDYKLKSGYLPYEKILDYIIVNILGV